MVKDPGHQSALDLSTKLLTLPTVATVQTQSKALLSSLFTSRAAFHWHKVCRQLNIYMNIVSVDAARLVGGAGSVIQWSIHLSVCMSD